MRAILVTGGCGFIGSHFVRHLLAERPDVTVVNLDLLTYAGNPDNLADVAHHFRYRFVHGDIADRPLVERLLRNGVDAVVNLAAESHVDRSIRSPDAFVRTNVVGTSVLLEAARQAKVPRFLQVSTDEVYGSLGPTGAFTEDSPLAPNSPYAASKAAADLLVRASFHTHGLPGLITRSANNFGPFQFPEKLIPLFITNALEDKPLPLYGDGRNVRDWIHVEDHCVALLAVLERGRAGEVYNIGAGHEVDNLALTHLILAELGKPQTLIHFVPDRPGHDRRCAVDASKIQKELNWRPRKDFSQALRATVRWYVEHRTWWERVKSGAHREFGGRPSGRDHGRRIPPPGGQGGDRL